LVQKAKKWENLQWFLVPLGLTCCHAYT